MSPLDVLFSEKSPSLDTAMDISLRKKDPWLAANLSLFFPGLGQFYGEKWTKGTIFFLGQLILIGATLWSIFAPDGNILTGLITLLLAGILYVLNILDAHLGVYYSHFSSHKEKIPRKQKNPWFAVFVSRVLPGLGHLYLNRSVAGLSLITVSLIFLQVNNFSDAWLFLVPLITAIAVHDAYRIFSRSSPRYPRSLIAAIAGLVFLSGLGTTYFPRWVEQNFQQFVIPSESMFPTLHIGDRVLVTHLQDFRPQRGDIVIFSPPPALKDFDADPSDFFIKRVIALPNDRVEVQQNQVRVNGEILQEPYIAQPPLYQLREITVPPDAYFVLGDNRNDSLDSHIWGFLPKELIFGKAYKISWPFSRVQSLLLR